MDTNTLLMHPTIHMLGVVIVGTIIILLLRNKTAKHLAESEAKNKAIDASATDVKTLEKVYAKVALGAVSFVSALLIVGADVATRKSGGEGLLPLPALLAIGFASCVFMAVSIVSAANIVRENKTTEPQ